MNRTCLIASFLVMGACAADDAPADTDGGTTEASETEAADTDPPGTSSPSTTDATSTTGPTSTTSPASTTDDSDGSTGPADESSSDSGDPPLIMSPGCGLEPGDVLDGQIETGGVMRDYLIRVPADYDPDVPYPLVFGFHGTGPNASAITGEEGYLLFERYDEEAIVVYPDGLPQGGGNPSWNSSNGSADMNFVIDLVEAIGFQMCIDLPRIYAFGYSAGGYMANSLACFRGDVFSGVGAVSAGAPGAVSCQKPIAAFLAHGETDPVIPFATGEAARESYLELSGCSNETIPFDHEGCVEYTDCDAAAPVVWCTHPGGHQFDGRYPRSAINLWRRL